MLLALACGQLSDMDGAAMEFDAARWVFDQLGAVPDGARLETLSDGDVVRNDHAPSARTW